MTEKPIIPTRNAFTITDGVRIQSMEDFDMQEIREIRNAWLEYTDIYALIDRYNTLTTQQQNELATFRQSLRDVTIDFSSANEAADNFPTPPDWL